MEYTAVMAAAKHCRSHLLTASMDSVNFLRPTRVGDVVLIKGIVTQAFSHSVEVYVTVETESLSAESRQMTNNGWLTIVAVDDQGDLVRVPRLVMGEEEESGDEVEKAREARARARRDRRLKERALVSSLFIESSSRQIQSV
jgi:acyl-CoA hydrolase